MAEVGSVFVFFCMALQVTSMARPSAWTISVPCKKSFRKLSWQSLQPSTSLHLSRAKISKSYGVLGLIRLSKRNCVQLIMKLQELNLIELMYTADGKVVHGSCVVALAGLMDGWLQEYLTADKLRSEIKDEIYVHNGRLGRCACLCCLNAVL